MKDDEGSVSVEAAVCFFGLTVLLLALTVIFLVGSAKLAVNSAANSSARAASLARTPLEGEAAARKHASDILKRHCASTRQVVDAAALGAPPGSRGEVTVEISCTVKTFGFSSSLYQTQSEGKAAVDRFRGR